MSDEKLIPAVIYIRMSSKNQEASPDQQRAEVAKLATKYGCHVMREYFDEAISGDDTARRIGFQQMHADACNGGGFEVILCWDQDRFGRFDSIEAGYWIKPLRDKGIKLITVAQGPISWDDFAGRMIYSIQQEGKNAYLRDLSRNVLRGKMAASLRGEWTGGPPLYGYMIVNKRLVPDPITAPIIRRIFEEYATGNTSLRGLAEMLNAERIPAPGRKKWRFSRVRKYLSDDTYTGVWTWPKNPDGKYNHATADGIADGPNTRKQRGYRTCANPVIIPHNHEPLISKATFDKCQRLLAERKRNTSPYKAGNPYLLAGLLKCGHCGGSMVGIQRTYRGHPEWTNRSYVCASYQQGGRVICDRYYVREPILVDVLTRKLQEDFLEPARLEQLRHEIRKQLKPAKTTGRQTIGRLQAQLTRLDKRIDQGTEKLLAAPADLTGLLTSKLQTWQQERRELQAHLEAHQRPQKATGAKMEALVDQAIGELQTLRERLHEADPELVRSTLRELVVKVDVYFRRVAKQKRSQSELVRGLIHLRPQLQSVKLVSGGSTEGKSHEISNIPSNDAG